MLTKSDINQLEKKGISVETVKAQLDKFVTGFPYLRLQGAATPGNGVIVLDDKAMEQSVERWEKYIADGGEAMKMVPASGAASRMFKALFAFVDSESDRPEPDSDVAQVIENIDRFAFAPELDNALKSLHGLTAKELIAAGAIRMWLPPLSVSRGLITAICRKPCSNFTHIPMARALLLRNSSQRRRRRWHRPTVRSEYSLPYRPNTAGNFSKNSMPCFR